MLRWIITLLVFVSLSSVRAQEGKVYFNIAPIDAVIKVGDSTYQSRHDYPFPIGEYVVKAWRMNHELLTDTFLVEAGKTTYVTMGLPESDAYKNFKRRNFTYHASIVGLRYVSTALYAGYIYTQVQELNRLERLTDDTRTLALEQKDIYDSSVFQDEISNASERYQIYKVYYNLYRNAYYQKQSQFALGATIFGFGLVAAQILAVLQDKPVYDEPVRLSFQPTFTGKTAGLSMNFNLNKND